MREGWKVTPLKTLCRNIKDDIVDGPFGANLKREHYTSNGVPVLKIQNIKPFRITLKKMDYVDADKARELKRHSYKKGDIIITKLGLPLGASALVDEGIDDGIIVADLVRVRAEKIDSKFLCYHLNSPATNAILNAQQGGATRPRVKILAVRELPINVPSLPEQKRIVAILDEAFAGIATAVANAEKNLANARELFESYLTLVLLDKQWKWKRLGDLCQGFEYGSSAKSKKDGMVPVVRMGNIQGGQIRWQDLVYSDSQDEINRYLLKHNDVLFNRTNSPELVGKTAVYKGERPAIFAGYLIRVNRIEDQLDADYLNYFLNSRIAFDHGKSVVTSSVNQANINATKLSDYPIPAPSLAEQQRIVGGLNELWGETQRINRIYQQKSAALAELKQSLLQKVFSGELTAVLQDEIETALA